ncbi:MAG TPA: hypothetical protein VK826_20650 [Bacteroidia bacterium]|nr:hypothetical protein [Bacteroidia bacterium]
MENDIHPEALKKLLALIVSKSNQNQFIVSTHSHIVLKYLGAAPDSKIFYTEWSPHGTDNAEYKNIPTSHISEIQNTPESRMQILHKLGYEFQDFDLYHGYLLLEESSAEQIIRDFLIPSFAPELYGRIKTIAARGVDDLEVRVQDFNRLFVFIHTNPIYNKRAWVMADGDEAGQNCIAKLKEIYSQWPREHFGNFTAHRFEEYYPTRFQKDVQAVFAAADRKKRQQRKSELLQKVVQWAFNNREDAVTEFSESASEVIQFLKKLKPGKN